MSGNNILGPEIRYDLKSIPDVRLFRIQILDQILDCRCMKFRDLTC